MLKLQKNIAQSFDKLGKQLLVIKEIAGVCYPYPAIICLQVMWCQSV